MTIKRNLGYYQLFLIYFLGIIIISCTKKDLPEIITSEVTSITQTTANCGGTITSDGGTTVLSRGVCWSTNNTPFIDDKKTTNGAGAGSFESAITELTPNTTYFVRAYATNASGTGYGMAMSFTTEPATIPVLTTANVTTITQNTATCGGTITSDGAASITARGVCWSTTQNPTTADSKTSDGSGTGIFTSALTELIGNTTYYVRAYATNSAGTQYGNQISFKTNPLIPTLTTATTSSISQTTATSGGNISSDGGSTVTARGVCWSTSENPTTSDSKTSDGSGIGSFTSTLLGLTTGTTYYVRAYATNSVGTAYGTQVSIVSGQITDIDGNIYTFVTIGTQTWMKENLKTTKYTNGDLIGTTTPATLDISSESTPKYQWAYDGNESNVATNGRLYTWYAVTDSRGVCPIGWHLPSDAEWTTLTDYLTNNGYGYGGSGSGIAKSMAATSGWITYTTAGTVGNDQASNNSSGFTALPSGNRGILGTFYLIGDSGLWWSSAEYTDVAACNRFVTYYFSTVVRGFDLRYYGFSVRCLKN